MHHRIAAVEPAVQALETVHESLRRRTVIRLAVLEFVVVDPGLQALFLDAAIHQFSQCGFYDFHELIFLLTLCILCDHGEIRLQDPILVAAHDIIADPRV